MIRRISLQNYMSHPATVIEPAAGLTVLVGPNNCGKSAVVSALDTLCNNASGAYMVRHDEREARVEVETDDGHTLVWKRRGSTVSYTIDGRDVHRVRRGIPDDLHALLRLPKVDAGENGDPFDIHFGHQKSPIFLLNEPESRAALFFASSSDAAILLEMQRRHRAKVKDRKNDERRLTNEIGHLDAELDALKPLDSVALAVEQVEREHEEMTSSRSEVVSLRQRMETLESQLTKHRRLEAEASCLASLESLPKLSDTATLESLIGALDRTAETVSLERGRVDAVARLATPPTLADAGPIEITVSLLAAAENSARMLRLESKALRDLQTPPVLADSDALADDCQAIERQVATLRLHSAREECLRALAIAPAIATTESLVKTIREQTSGQMTHDLRHRQAQILKTLVTPPCLNDTMPLASLVDQIHETTRAVEQLTLSAGGYAEHLENLFAADRFPAALSPQLLAPLHTRRGLRKPTIIAISGFGALAAVVAFVAFGRPLLNRLVTPSDSTSGPLPRLVSPTPVATHGPDETKPPATGRPMADAVAGDRPNGDAGSERAKPTTPSVAGIDNRRREKLQEVRQILSDADVARAKGKHLDAVLNLGRAAMQYPSELAEVATPEDIRAKFLESLRQLQAAVEHALDNAANRKGGPG